jgi:hypothetical protein
MRLSGADRDGPPAGEPLVDLRLPALEASAWPYDNMQGAEHADEA